MKYYTGYHWMKQAAINPASKLMNVTFDFSTYEKAVIIDHLNVTFGQLYGSIDAADDNERLVDVE